jgi:hypothetical protein
MNELSGDQTHDLRHVPLDELPMLTQEDHKTLRRHRVLSRRAMARTWFAMGREINEDDPRKKR